MVKKICWGITGAGDYLLETVNVMRKIQNEFSVKITVIVSKNGELVLKWYKMYEKVQQEFKDFRIEKGPNIPFIVGPLQTGSYEFLFVSPMTGNTTAKIALGIADSLLTNAVAQALKGGVPVYAYPVDQKSGEVVTVLPDGKKFTLKSRDIDLKQVEELRKMEDLTVLSHPEEILEVAKNTLQEKRE